MTDNDIYEKLATVFDDVFEYGGPLRPETVAADVKDWDSVGHIRLILTCEEAFGCRFAPKEVTGLNNVGDLVAMIREKTE